MCGSFTCSKNCLILINLFYMIVSIILMAVAGAAKYAAIVTSLKIVSGIIACGVFLLLISLVGLVAAARHHQVLLFFYMVVLFFIFVIQFAVACACLAINEDQQQAVAREGWRVSDNSIKMEAQAMYHCCGYDNSTYNDTSMGHPSCAEITNASDEKCCPEGTPADLCCTDSANSTCSCPTCKDILTGVIGGGFSAAGGVGLFFSFLEFIGVWMTFRYRNQRDPRGNPSDFL